MPSLSRKYNADRKTAAAARRTTAAVRQKPESKKINNMKLKTYIRNALATAVMLLVASAAWAQSRNITGIVFDTDGKSPLVGATVILKGSATGTISNADGTYTIHVGSDNDVLVFQSLGYDPQEVTVGSRTTINVTLKESAQKIDEVVVTALGLTRSEKSVGYAVSKVSGDELTKSISSNWVTGLNGKVAGMSMSSAGTGPGGTVRVTLRGDTSLNYGANEALFVIDGIPMSNGTVASGSGANYANSNAPVDFGNPISDLNPDDIENVSVLKGPAAAALYGSMGQNGVVLITTKSGREQRGIGVTYNGSVTFETAGFWPEFPGGIRPLGRHHVAHQPRRIGMGPSRHDDLRRAARPPADLALHVRRAFRLQQAALSLHVEELGNRRVHPPAVGIRRRLVHRPLRNGRYVEQLGDHRRFDGQGYEHALLVHRPA